MAFHWKDGWYFERLDAKGTVRIYHEELVKPSQEEHPEYDVVIDIDPASWASIVASVTPQGDNADTFHRAENFHTI